MTKTATNDLNKGAAAAAHFHKSAAGHHESLHKHHSEMAAFSKGKHDAMDDGHEMKAYMAKAHEHHVAKAAHHEALHKLHKARAEECEDMDKATMTTTPSTTPTTKAAGSPDPAAATPTNPDPANPTPAAEATPATSDGIDGMLKATTTGLVKSALEMLKTDPTVQDEIRKMVLEGVRSALGSKVIPDHVRGVMPDVPIGSASTEGKLVLRNGAPPVDKAAIPAGFADLFSE